MRRLDAARRMLLPAISVPTTLTEFERETKRDGEISLRKRSDAFRPITDTAPSISYWRLRKR